MESPSLEQPKPPPAPAPLTRRLLGLGTRTRALFYRDLATMVGAGVSLLQALHTTGKHLEPELCSRLAAHIESGATLASALSRYPYYFSDFETNLVRAGETSGSLDERLADLADTLEQTHRLQQELVGKLIYPALVLHAAFLIPPLPLLITSGLPTYLLASAVPLVSLYALAFLVWLLYRLGAQGAGVRRIFDQALLLVPILGTAVRKLALARFLHALGQLYHAGVSPVRSVLLAAGSCGNRAVSRRLEQAAEPLRAGVSLSDSLRATGLLPPIALQMVQTGEEAGRVGPMAARAAGYMHQEVATATQRVMTVLPVILLLIVGGIVGALVIGRMVPQILGPLNEVLF